MHGWNRVQLKILSFRRNKKNMRREYVFLPATLLLDGFLYMHGTLRRCLVPKSEKISVL